MGVYDDDNIAIGESKVGRAVEEHAGVHAGNAGAGAAGHGVAKADRLAANGAAQVDADRGAGGGRIGDIEIIGRYRRIDGGAVEIEGHTRGAVQADVEIVEGQRRAKRAGNIDAARGDALQVDRAKRDGAAAGRGDIGQRNAGRGASGRDTVESHIAGAN